MKRQEPLAREDEGVQQVGIDALRVWRKSCPTRATSEERIEPKTEVSQAGDDERNVARGVESKGKVDAGDGVQFNGWEPEHIFRRRLHPKRARERDRHKNVVICYTKSRMLEGMVFDCVVRIMSFLIGILYDIAGSLCFVLSSDLRFVWGYQVGYQA